MTRRLTWRCGQAYLATLVAFACSEARIGLLEPIGATTNPTEIHDAGDDSRPAGGLLNAACVEWSAEREPDSALMMWVVDVSGTMSIPIPGSQTSKWDVERPVLSNLFGLLPARVGLGVLYFPNMATQASTSARPASACVNVAAMIPVGMLGSSTSAQRTMLTQSLANTQPEMQEGAPTIDAYLAGLEQLGVSSLDGRRSMLLVTDGNPTFSEGCVGSGLAESPVDPTPLVDAISQARRAGIRTFVIGAPGSNYTDSRGDDARPWLSRAAEAGGTATRGCSDTGPSYCHYDLSNVRDFSRSLDGALDDIARRVVRCDVPLPNPPMNQIIDPTRVNVVFTGGDGTMTVLPRDDSQTCGAGWQYSLDQQSIVLCSQACSQVNADLGTRLELVFGCNTVVP